MKGLMEKVLFCLLLGERMGRTSRRGEELEDSVSQTSVTLKCHLHEFCFTWVLSVPTLYFQVDSLLLF